MWCCPVTPETLGLAGAAQVIRVERDVQQLRRGQVVKETHEVAFPFTSFWPDEAGPAQLQELVRGHWTIENGQHHRRDRTQDEDRCTVSHSTTARNLSLFRSLAIFLFEAQRGPKGAQQSLPDFERHACRQPAPFIRRFISGARPK